MYYVHSRIMFRARFFQHGSGQTNRNVETQTEMKGVDSELTCTTKPNQAQVEVEVFAKKRTQKKQYYK